MATRSVIIAPTNDGRFRGVYCHSDGYPEAPHGVGAVLFFYYSGMVRLPSGCRFHKGRGKLAEAKVNALLDLGDLSSLGKHVAPPKRRKHSFDKRLPDVTVAYGRDRGETGVEAKVEATAQEVAERIDHQFMYVFKDGKWWMNGAPLTFEIVCG